MQLDDSKRSSAESGGPVEGDGTWTRRRFLLAASGALLTAGCASPSPKHDQPARNKAGVDRADPCRGRLKLTLREFELPLKHAFTISRGTQRVVRTLIVELAQDGRRGYGEGPESTYYQASQAAIRAALEQARSRIEAARCEDPVEFWREVQPALEGHPFAQCALDEAAHDLWGKQRGQQVWKLWGLD